MSPTEPPKDIPAPEVPLKPEEIVTEEILNGILKSVANNRPNLELLDFDAKLGTIAGDNYMSVIYAVTLNMKNTVTGAKEQVPIMLKVLPRNELRIKMINEGNIFVRDIQFYDTIAPAMEQFQRDRGIPEDEIATPWPKCYASKTDGKGDFLAMEDLKAEGFKMANRKLGLDLEHSKIVMRTLARFHATSYAMFQGDYDKILETYPWTEELMFSDEKSPGPIKEMFKSTFGQQATILREAGEEEGASHIDKMAGEGSFEVMQKLVGNKIPWAVIGHGDCWTNNFLFRYDEETNKPIDIKLVDFQMSRTASRTIDLHYFFYASLQAQVLNDKEEELEEIYYEEFTKFVKRLGVDVDAHKLTKENFLKEITTFRYFGCGTGLMLAMITSAESGDVPEMDTVTEEDMQDVEKASQFFLSMMKERAMEKVKNIAVNHLPKCPQLFEL